MPLALGSRSDVWTHGSTPGVPTARAWTHLADVVTAAVKGIEFKGRRPIATLEEAIELLSGERLLRLRYAQKIEKKMLERHLKKFEPLYGLGDLNKGTDHRPARSLLLFASEYRLAPLVEGLIHATEWAPTSTRLDLRGAFHLVSRWWTQSEPRVVSRLAISALSTVDGPRPYRPLTRLYAGVLRFHRAQDRVDAEAEALSTRTTEVLFDAYKNQSSKREIMLRLFRAAEELAIIERRPSFDVEPALRRRHELTRLALDLELGREIESSVMQLIALLGAELQR